jgi:hypothetical protein
MSWDEMEKELASDHGVPVGQLRKVLANFSKLSELQGLLERHRSAANVKTEIGKKRENLVGAPPEGKKQKTTATDAAALA